MAARIETAWRYNSEKGTIDCLREPPMKPNNGPMVGVRFLIKPETKFDRRVWENWWNGGPLVISSKEFILYPDTQNPPILEAKRIERARKGSRSGQIFMGARAL